MSKTSIPPPPHSQIKVLIGIGFFFHSNYFILVCYFLDVSILDKKLDVSRNLKRILAIVILTSMSSLCLLILIDLSF